MDGLYYVYIMTNVLNRVLYVGVTNDLKRRVAEHRLRKEGTFTGKYVLVKLVYYETFKSISDAIRREKQLKGGSRAKKLQLIAQVNPDWDDLG